MTTGNIACIDLGSNSCRLRISDQKGNVIYKDSKPTKLGEGLFETGLLSNNSIGLAIQALSEYAALMKQNNVEKYKAVATAACRTAKNGKEFVRLVKLKTGLDLEIIDAIEEARLNLKGAMLNAPKNKEYVVVYDLGGASTEITLAENNSQARILHTISIPWGARNASEAFRLKEFDEKKALELEKEIQNYTRDFALHSDLKKYHDKCCLLATSSTPLRLCSILKKDGSYTREKNDGACVACKDIDKIVCAVEKMSLDQREKSAYIGQDRAPIFVAACVIFKAIYDVLGFDEFIVSFKSAQDAMLEELKNG